MKKIITAILVLASFTAFAGNKLVRSHSCTVFIFDYETNSYVNSSHSEFRYISGPNSKKLIKVNVPIFSYLENQAFNIQLDSSRERGRYNVDLRIIDINRCSQ